MNTPQNDADRDLEDCGPPDDGWINRAYQTPPPKKLTSSELILESIRHGD